MATCNSEARIGIVKLSNSNYSMWKFGAQMLLLKEDLWKIIEEIKPEPVTPAWKRRDESARATIALSIEPNLHYLIQNCVSAAEMWNTVKTHFERLSYSSRIFLKKKLLKIKLEGNNMTKYLSQIMEIVDRLRCSGEIYNDPEIISIILCGLPETYDGLIMGLEAREEKSLVLDDIKIKLIDEAERKSEGLNINHQVLTAVDRSNVRPFLPRKPIICYNCNQQGHIRNRCPNYRRNMGEGERLYTTNMRQDYRAKQFENKSTTEKREIKPLVEDAAETNFYLQDQTEKFNDECSEYFSYTTSMDDESKSLNKQAQWIIDSGASNHMCHSKEILHNYKSFAQPREVTFANGTKNKAVGEGSTTICSYIQGQKREITVDSVILVPEMKVNLLSVTKLCLNEFQITFQENDCEIKKNNQILLKGHIEEGIFTVDNVITPLVANFTCVHTWHRRLGHRNLESIKGMVNKDQVKNLKIDPCGHDCSDYCEACKISGMIQKPFQTVTNKQSQKPFQLLHTDLCGPMNPISRGGGNYILTITDDYSRYSYIKILKYKSEAGKAIMEYLLHFRNKFGYMPSNIRSDGGGEFNNKELESFLKLHGIRQQLSIPYTPQQNGVAERINRTLMRMTKCMMKQNNLNRDLWGEGMSLACYLYNRVSHSYTGQTPFSLWEGELPDLKHIRIMGSYVHYLINKPGRSKLGDNAREGILLGFSEYHKGYKVLDLKDSSIVITRNISVNENRKNPGKAADDQQFMNVQIIKPNENNELDESHNTIRKSERETRGKTPARYLD